jgi:hypothetical protein
VEGRSQDTDGFGVIDVEEGASGWTSVPPGINFKEHGRVPGRHTIIDMHVKPWRGPEEVHANGNGF